MSGILGVVPTASAEEIKKAYQRESLRSHPDRFPKASPSEKREHTRRFQNYILSDPDRRREYDAVRPGATTGSSTDPDEDVKESTNFFRSFFGANSQHGEYAQPQPEQQFAETWEDLLRPELERVGHGWQYAGAVAGSVLGYIIGNIPGALGGGLLGGKRSVSASTERPACSDPA
ncbi:hypothetical protein CBS14141_001196 [Malassezia furfur]|nr:hypothetical protein CBS14141_001196 [Malassezia furfur]